MDTRRWRQIDSILQLALDRDEEGRQELLGVACGDDSELRSEVERLLDLEDRAPVFLKGLENWKPDGLPADEGREPRNTGRRGETVLGDEPPDPRVGGAIGSYRILDLLGHGGMGSVYRAERDDGEIHRQVAIKVSRRELVSQDTLRRFRQERQILASLDHPNIARLIDGGATEDGRPYVVMELVDGVPIDTYCDERRHGVRERLELVLKVCGAVSKAHQSLIVHRDLKPNNILVAKEGEPKLLDFGIAKPLDPESFPLTVSGTRTGWHPMTPDYASPEQVNGRSVRTASDVYSLGVVIYELLTGQLPHRLTGLSPAEMLRVVSESQPQLPSKAVVGAGLPTGRESTSEAKRASAEWRGTSPQQLSRELSGDLDTILRKALRNDPDRRYQTVGELSEDLRRYLVGLPVLARPETWRYLASKFVRRNTAAVFVGVAFLLLLIGFGVNLVAQTQRLAVERDKSEASRVRAATEQEKAEQVAAFMTSIFEQSDPHQALGEELTARDLLDRSAQRISEELVGQPEVKATALRSIGKVYLTLQLSDEAQPLLEEALALREEILGPEHLDVASSLFDMAQVFHSRGEYDRARPFVERSMMIRSRALGENHPSLAESLAMLGGVQWVRGKYQQAEVYWTRALEIQEEEQQPLLVAGSWSRLGLLYEATGRADQALAAYEKTLEIREQHLDPFHPGMATIHNNLGALYGHQGLFSLALPHFERALEIRQKVYPVNHAFTGMSLGNLGKLYRSTGNFDAAEEFVRRAMEVLEASEETDYTPEWVEFARIRLNRGDPAGAESALLKGFEGVGDFPSDHPSVATLLETRGDILLARGEFEAAVPVLQEVGALYSKIYGRETDQVFTNTNALARAYAGLGEYGRAEASFDQARKGWQELLERFPSSATAAAGLADTYLGLGAIHQAQGDDASANTAWSRSIVLMEEIPGRVAVPSYLDVQARGLLLAGRIDEAIPIVEGLLRLGWGGAEFLDLVRAHGLDEV